MKIGWGWKIGILYGVFVAGIIFLVVSSSRQSFDLVSKKYYDAEIGYQKTIDANKNQAALSAPLSVHANGQAVQIEFPDEFRTKKIACEIEFYAPVNSTWDRNFKVVAENNSVVILRNKLRDTRYTVKVSYTVDGTNYYQESEIYLHS
jgi:hypothetical protein